MGVGHGAGKSEKKMVPIAAYSLAAIVSAARLSARRDYASDLLAGAGIGHLMGAALTSLAPPRVQGSEPPC